MRKIRYAWKHQLQTRSNITHLSTIKISFDLALNVQISLYVQLIKQNPVSLIMSNKVIILNCAWHTRIKLYNNGKQKNSRQCLYMYLCQSVALYVHTLYVHYNWSSTVQPYLARGHVRHAPVGLDGLQLVQAPVQLLQRLQGYPDKVFI